MERAYPTGEFTSLNLTLENGIDGTNVWDLTHAEIQGRQQVMWAVDVLRNYAKEMGFANCSLRSIAGQIGIRETRRIQGGYSICRRDVLGHSEFDDSIGVYTTFIDGEVVSKDDAHFQLPYRMILPNGIENLSVAGRCASCDDDAIQTVRMMVCCATTGQAAGTASALSIKMMSFCEISTSTLCRTSWLPMVYASGKARLLLKRRRIPWKL